MLFKNCIGIEIVHIDRKRFIEKEILKKHLYTFSGNLCDKRGFHILLFQERKKLYKSNMAFISERLIINLIVEVSQWKNMCV